MLVGILNGVAIEDISSRYLHKILGHIERIHRDKHIGHNTATAIDNLTLWSGELQRIGKVDAVGREELVVVVATHDVHIVLILMTILIRFLDRATCWGVITGNGQSQSRAIGIRHLLLHQTLTE